MANCYINFRVIGGKYKGGIHGSVAYAGGCRMVSPITGTVYDHSHRTDVLHRKVHIPDGAPKWISEPPIKETGRESIETAAEKTQRISQALWNAVIEKERVYDRKTKRRRYRKRAQFGYRLILALPAGRPLAELIELANDFLYEHFGRHGIPYEFCIHAAEDAAGLNIHLHATIATRPLGPDGFGKKARRLLPDFVGRRGNPSGRIRTGHEWPRRWAAFQNHWYQRRDIDVVVDPIAAVPGIHIGRWRDEEISAERRALNQAKKEAAAAIARDPEKLLRVIEDQLPIFGLKDVLRHLRRNGVMGYEAKDIANRLLALPDIVALRPRTEQMGVASKCISDPEPIFTTQSILDQEEKIRSRVEYLYGDMVWGKPLPAGMKEYAEQLIAARGLDPEQAEAVLYSVEGPGIRVIQGVAGAGKSYLLATAQMVFQQFGHDVIAMAPTNMVAADLRKNGFKASTIHKFIRQVRRGKIKLKPGTVLVVDEAAMVDAKLFEALTEIASRYQCRLILSGDDRQLPPIGRGGVYGKIRQMVGDARLSRVRRQSEDWMRAASESLSTWDIQAGIEAYKAKGAIAWSGNLRDAAMALAVRCLADLRTDPYRDLSKFFIYCALNDSANIMNNAMQDSIWRDAPPAPVHELDCCRGLVKIRAGDRIQFHETDLKQGLFNGAIGTVSSIDAAGIRVRLDSGEDVHFDPREFKGWGLGYAGTVHRGQGQTKLRSYVLYDHPYLWSAALTYVALTRHKDTTALFVPRELARDEAALIHQMSRVTEQPLASDYVPVDPQKARAGVEAALYPLQPLVPWKILGEDGKEKLLDLNRKGDAEQARSWLRRLPAEQFPEAYARLCAKSRGKPGAHPYQTLMLSAVTTAAARGFLPGSGGRDPRCLVGLFHSGERDHHLEHPALSGEGTEIDVSNCVVDPNQIEVGVWQNIAQRVLGFDGFIRDALYDRLTALRKRFASSPTLHDGLAAAQFLIRICRYTGTGIVPTDATVKAAIADESAPRVFGAFKFWRDLGHDDHEDVPLAGAIRYAFGSEDPAPQTAPAGSVKGIGPQKPARTPQRPPAAASAPPPAAKAPLPPRPGGRGDQGRDSRNL